MIAALYIIALRVYNAYDITGFYDTMEKNFDPSVDVQKSSVPDLLQNPGFGKLRKQNQLKEVKEQTRSLVASLNWVVANQKALCERHGTDSYDGDPRNRIGMVFNKGFCIPVAYKQALIDPLLEIINGKVTYTEQTTAEGLSFKAQVNYLALVDHPVSDIRELGPFKFNTCGSLLSAEPSFGGAFPNREGNQLWPLWAPKCERP